MRIMIKGGVWKNTEDEILKAAVMKYGKNQWARISSLLVRKSAKQCKARWYEWLDPSIKKTEWTREEDEKLLHLAKLMPTQWRTIAPIVGRTPSQCLERYEKLLDAACVKDENYEPADDPRKLRPGEIDPNPESKPARPDPVDMDEDEKEMLSEARARLANTRGKKAKRKAREKQLEEARRLASLQKRRELKAAGIDGKQRKRKRKGIDYNAEIPFEKKPPPGFFDVADEERQVVQPQFPTTIEELEGKRRVDIEAQLRKQDIARNKIVQRHDAPSAVMQVNKLNDPEAVRKRSKLMLPAPQISDRELEEIAKMGYASDLVVGEDELAGGSGATRDLLANYNQTPRLGMTPLRTPQRTPGGKGDAIMMEAENQARLREAQTPLFGGENPELHPSDFSGVTPRKREVQTPNPMATPMHTPGAVGLTPRIGTTPSRELSAFGMTPKGTPIRDELHINEGMETPEIFKAESRRQAEIRRNLRAGLNELPVPQNEYQIVIPDPPTEDIEAVEQMEEDMSDRLAREKAEEAARQAALLRKRSKVLQRSLPRPPLAAVDFLKNSLKSVADDSGSLATANFMEQADELIRKELISLLEHDNVKYPLEDGLGKERKKGNKNNPNGKPQVPVPQIDDFDEGELIEASQLIEEEVSILRVGMGHEEASVDDFSEAHNACLEDMTFFPGRNTYGLASVASVTEKLAALQNEFENVRNHMESGTRKAVRLEQKLKMLTQGYQVRAGKLWTQMETAFKQADTAGTELECFRALHKQEELAASTRIESLQEAVRQQKELERQLQIRFENLLVEQANMQKLLLEYKESTAQQNDTSIVDDRNPVPVQLDSHQVDMDILETDKVVDGSDAELPQLASCEVGMGGLETEKVVTEALEVQFKGNDIAMLDSNEAFDGHSSFSPAQEGIEKVSGPGQDKEGSDNSENVTKIKADHVLKLDGANSILENIPIDQVTCGQTAVLHGEHIKQVMQQQSDPMVTLDGHISVADGVDAQHEKHHNTDMVAQTESQDTVLTDDNIEQSNQQNAKMVTQSDVKNDVSMDENAEQENKHDTALVAQPDGLFDKNVGEAKQHKTDLVADSDGQNGLVNDKDIEQVEKEKEMVELSIPSLNDIKEDVIEPVKLQNQPPMLVVELSVEDSNRQVEILDNMEQGISAQAQPEVGNKAEDPNKQLQDLDGLEKDVSAQTEPEVGNTVDGIASDCKARFEEQPLLSKADAETENVITTEREEIASHSEHVKS